MFQIRSWCHGWPGEWSDLCWLSWWSRFVISISGGSLPPSLTLSWSRSQDCLVRMRTVCWFTSWEITGELLPTLNRGQDSIHTSKIFLASQPWRHCSACFDSNNIQPQLMFQGWAGRVLFESDTEKCKVSLWLTSHFNILLSTFTVSRTTMQCGDWKKWFYLK